jgi:hypothetical protein
MFAALCIVVSLDEDVMLLTLAIVNNYDTRGRKLGTLHCHKFSYDICEASEDIAEYAIKFKEMYLTILFVVPLCLTIYVKGDKLQKCNIC